MDQRSCSGMRPLRIEWVRRKLELHQAVERCPSRDIRLDLPSGKVAPKTVPPRPRKRVLASDLDTVMVDSLKALDLIRPIREADMDTPTSRWASLGVNGSPLR